MNRRIPLPWSAALCLSTALLAATPLRAAVVAAADYLVAVEDEMLTFRIGQLLANDEFVGNAPQVAVTLQPVHGELQCSSACSYLPAEGYTGMDAFTYSLVDGKHGADSAEVRIQVSPVVVPLAGDWDSNGVTDLGWFHATFQDAFFFDLDPLANDFRGDSLGCGNLPLPPEAEGWTPFAGDWNGDGRGEVGVFDPATREYTLFGRSPDSTDLIEWQRFVHPVAGQGGAPVAGDWNGDGFDQVGLYLDAERRFLLLESFDEQVTVSHDVVFQDLPDGSWAPVAGRWGGDDDGIHTLGLWNPDTRDLVIRYENTSGVPEAWPYAIDDEDPAGPFPFAGNWGYGVSIGFYDPHGGGTGQPWFVLYPWDFADDPIIGGDAIVLIPPVDPLVAPCVQ